MATHTYHFLAACIRGDSKELQRLVGAPGWHWPELVQAASDEGVLPGLNAYCATLPELPEDVGELLSCVESSNRERNFVIADEIEHSALLLNRRGIQPVLLKGAAYLAANIYVDPASRYIGDIDLLIPEDELPDAVAALEENGYFRDQRDPFGEYRHHYPPLARTGRPPIELHRSLGLENCARLLPAREAIAESKLHVSGRASVRIPHPEHLATHLIMHSQLQHSYTERIWPPLRALWDLAALRARYGSALNWGAIGERFRRAGQFGVLALHLQQVAASLRMTPFFEFESSPLIRLRWLRRKALYRWPALRYIDPLYMFSTVLGRRISLMQNLLTSRKGRSRLSAQLSDPYIYTRLLTDLLEGRGR
jgi:hypothetical protein